MLKKLHDKFFVDLCRTLVKFNILIITSVYKERIKNFFVQIEKYYGNISNILIIYNYIYVYNYNFL